MCTNLIKTIWFQETFLQPPLGRIVTTYYLIWEGFKRFKWEIFLWNVFQRDLQEKLFNMITLEDNALTPSPIFQYIPLPLGQLFS